MRGVLPDGWHWRGKEHGAEQQTEAEILTSDF
jgi:hypothetical protein